jgi:UDP-N-acetylglucosamine 4,6-dehydratase
MPPERSSTAAAPPAWSQRSWAKETIDYRGVGLRAGRTMSSIETPQLSDKTVLVTGGTGTIGSAIVRQLLATAVGGIRIYSRDEHKQFELERVLPRDERLRFLIGDTRDLRRLRRAVEGVDLVFHAAAMKHVLSCEYNPFEAVQTNVVGTQNVIEAALDAGVERVMFASSDKAVNPTSTMGVSKLMAEKLMAAANAHRGAHPTIFTSVRFGNVVGSRGSVMTVFADQIAIGGPITLTDPRMTRFIMSIDHAVDLMLTAIQAAHGGEVFVLKMPALRIADLAAAMREQLAPVHGFSPDEIEIQEIGAKRGEKFLEELVSDEELSRCLETDEMYILLPDPRVLEIYPEETELPYRGARVATADAARSDRVELMSREQLLDLLVETRYVERERV